MSSYTVTDANVLLKVRYAPGVVPDATYKFTGPAMKMIKKDTSLAKGEYIVVPIISGAVANGGPTFSTASANQTPARATRFTVSRTRFYQTFTIDGEVLAVGSSDEGSLLNQLEFQVNNCIRTVGGHMGRQLYGNGSNQIGTIGATTTLASTTMVLSNAADAVNFERGQVLVLAANDSSAPRAGTLTVTGVNRSDTATVTLSGNISAGVAAAALGDAVFVQGTYVSAGDRLGFPGFGAWIPSTDPTSTAFNGVDRSVDPTRLAGQRIAGTGLSFSAGLLKAVAKLGREGMGDVGSYKVFCSWSDCYALMEEREAKLWVTNQSDFKVGAGGLTVLTPNGPMEIMPDLHAVDGTAYVIDVSTFCFASAKEAPHIFDIDGTMLLRDASSDSYSGRIGYYGSLICTNPGVNAVITNWGR